MYPLATLRVCVPATLLTCLTVATPLLLLSAPRADAATVCPTGNGQLDARLARIADQGVVPFVQFVHRTRVIYQIDVNEALARVATYRQHAAACKAAVEE